MMRIVSVLVSSLLFGLGLEIAQMTNPQKVIGFLNITEKWDPSLIFVMVGAILINTILFHLTKKKAKTLFGDVLQIPDKTDIDKSLLTGTAIFGIGWGMGGFCPGPAISGLFRGEPGVYIVIASMLVGMFVAGPVQKFLSK
jgi:uncharacterized protein